MSDLPLASGLNEVRVTIQEQGKPPRIAILGIPFDEALLEPGKIDYAISFGTVRNRLEPYGAARAAIGVGRFLQLGSDLEAGYGSALGGVSALATTMLGSLGLEGATSFGFFGARAASPPAFAARGYWRFSSLGYPFAPQLGLAAEYTSIGFGPPSENAPQTTAALNISAQIGETLPWGIGSASAFGDATIAGGTLARWSATLGLTLPAFPLSLVSFSGGCDWSADSGLTPRAALALIVQLGAKQGLAFNHDFMQSADSIDLSLGFGEANPSTINIYGSGLVGTSVDRILDLAGTTTTTEAAFTGSGRYFRSSSGDASEISGTLSASSTLAYAEGVIAATSSPGNALAILVPAPALKGQRVELRPVDGVPAASARGGATLLSGLIPYRDYVADVEFPQSPPDQRPAPGSIEFSPEYRSVTVIRVGVASSLAVRGTLVDESGAPVANMPGDLVDANGEVIPDSGTFTDEKGVFECYELSPGPVSIRWGDGGMISFLVPEGEPGSFHDLGHVTVSVHGPVGGEK